jgi:hypothetical protein
VLGEQVSVNPTKDGVVLRGRVERFYPKSINTIANKKELGEVL